MMNTTLIYRACALAFGISLMGTGCGGCNNNEPEQFDVRPRTLSQRGESCLATNDCVDELACVSNICLSRSLNVSSSAKECYIIQCQDTADCCEPSQFCLDDRKACNDEGPDSFACDQAEISCACNLACMNNVCVFQGDDGGCENDDECFDGQACRDGVCEEICESNINCGLFEECRDEQCVEVGCSTQRECIALTDDSRATCVDKQCTIACTADSDCFSGGDYSVCEGGQCVSAGCESEQECRVLLNLANESENFSVECR